MTQDMKKDTIFHKISQRGVRLGQTRSQAGAVWESVWDGLRTTLLLLLLMMTVGVGQVWGQEPITMTTDKNGNNKIDNNEKVLYLIQSFNNEAYYIRDNNRSGSWLNTSNIVTTNSEFYFLNADIIDDTQYYYIVHNGTGKYVNVASAASGHALTYGNAPAADATEDNKDLYRFKITKNSSRDAYNIIAKNSTLSLSKTNGNSDGANIELNSTDSEISCWNFIAKTNYSKPAVPFTPSTSNGTKHIYFIQNNQYTTYYLISGTQYVTTNTQTDENKANMMWYFVKAPASENDPYIDYYYIIHAKTGKYLRYTKANNTEASDNAVELSDYNSSEDTRFLYIIVRGSVSGDNHTSQSTTYCIAPYLPRVQRVENTISLCRRTGSGAYTNAGVFKERGNNNFTHWSFIFVGQTCIDPAISCDLDGNIIMTSDEDATIYYTTDGTTTPTTANEAYSASSKPTVSSGSKTTIKAIAIAAGKLNSNVVTKTIFYNPTITLTAGSYTYNGLPQNLVTSVGYVDEVNSENNIPFTKDTHYTISYKKGTTVVDNCTDAGEYTIILSDVDGDDYIIFGSTTVTINKAGLSVTANDHSITYGDEPTNNGVAYSGFVNGETSSALGGSLAYAYSYERYANVGDNFTITPSGLTSNNYEITFTPGTLIVTQREVGLTWNPSDSSTPTATYDGASHAPTATATNLVNEDVIAVTVTGAQIDAGDYTATASGLTGDKAGNYSLPATNTQAFTIGKKSATVSGLTVSDKPYDGTTNATIDFSGAVIDGIVSGDDLSVASVTGLFDTKDVGVGKMVTAEITSGGTSAINYELSASGLTATISQKLLTIKANDNTIGFGSEAEGSGVTYDSFVTGENESLLVGTLTYAFNTQPDGLGEAYTTSSPKGIYYIIPSGLHLRDGNNNYTITFSYGTLTVGARMIGNGTDLAADFTANIDTSTSPYGVTLYDGSTELRPGTSGTDYDYSLDLSASTDRYFVATITGANNYSDAETARAIIKYANVKFDSDGSDGAMWYGTFVAEEDHATPTGMTPYIITSVDDNTATAVALDYIPNGEPVVLMNPVEAKGFRVQPRNGGEDADVSDNKLVVQTDDAAISTATVYLLYKGEFVLNRAGTLKAGTVYLPVPAGGGAGARLRMSRGDSTGIGNIEYTIDSKSEAWYTLDGRCLSSKPAKKGLYLQGGQKVVVK